MRVYHGSPVTVPKPQIIQPTRTLDYGCGFYTTSSYSQAERWIKRRKSNSVSEGYINIYEIEEIVLKTTVLNIKRFNEPSEEWVDFVMNNRLNKEYVHPFDIVWGPVANDQVYAAFALYENGLLDKDGLIRELKAYLLFDQMLFHTETALLHLKYVGSKLIAL
jgi:hypothetical protein